MDSELDEKLSAPRVVFVVVVVVVNVCCRVLLLLGFGQPAGRWWSSDGFVEQRGDVLFAVAVRGREDHDAVFDRQRVQVVQHDVVRLGEQRRLALFPSKGGHPKSSRFGSFLDAELTAFFGGVLCVHWWRWGVPGGKRGFDYWVSLSNNRSISRYLPREACPC